jgi:hypothetical protein
MTFADHADLKNGYRVRIHTRNPLFPPHGNPEPIETGVVKAVVFIQTPYWG